MTGFEPLIGAAAAGLGGLITSLVKDKGTETLKKLDWDIGKNLALKKAMVDYVRRYIDRHGTLKVACVRMDYPVRLDEIYTAVQLLDRSALRYFESEDALQEQYRESGKRSFSVTQAEKKPGLQVANEQQYLMVLGGPGVGKSTFLRKVGLEALRTLGRRDFAGKDPGNLLVPQQNYYERPCIPVMLELRQFDRANVSIQSVIAAELETCGFPHPEELTELFLKNGKLLVLLDGLDEVPSATLNHAITEIENLVDRYSDNRYIASCRVAAYTFGGFRRFKDVAMAAFENEQIKQFIKNWFQKPRDLDLKTAQKCWNLLIRKDHKAAKELAQTPLLLTLLCVVYDEFQSFPTKRHSLYGEALDVLMRKWASEKRIHRDPIYQELSAELELELLSEIAYTSFADNKLFFEKDLLIEQIREFLKDNLNAPSHLDAARVLREIEIQQGVLVERARDTYSFIHLTIQEYLTAKFIVENNKIDSLVKYHLIQERWQEVFLLTSGLITGKQGADTLLLAMEKKSLSYIKGEATKSLIMWSCQIVDNSSRSLSQAAKRAVSIFFILSIESFSDISLEFLRDLAFELVLNFDPFLDNLLEFTLEIKSSVDSDLAMIAADLANEYERVNVFNALLLNFGDSKNSKDASKARYFLKYSLGRYQWENTSEIDSLEKLVQLIKGNLGIDFNVAEFSIQEKRHLASYLYTLNLMFRCKETASRISHWVWSGIESRMVTVPTE